MERQLNEYHFKQYKRVNFEKITQRIQTSIERLSSEQIDRFYSKTLSTNTCNSRLIPKYTIYTN